MRTLAGVCWWGLAGVALTAAVSAEENPFLDVKTELCAEADLTIWGLYEDVTLYPGQSSDWFKVEEGEITWFCGGQDQLTQCPHDTQYVGVVRTGAGAFYVYCRSARPG